VVITVDDGTADCVGPLLGEGRWLPQLFVPTSAVGGHAVWLDDGPLASWDDLRALRAAGVEIGSHTRHHQRTTELPPAALTESIAGSRADLRTEIPEPLPIVAYPHGDHDDRTCTAAAEAGFLAGYTTEKGRNGAATDPFRLRRVSIHAADGALAALWKAATGEALPEFWLRIRRARMRAATRVP
jgi:peptidoglycan/xylan/chitin deacetylase (PgdA/CDA1 family)